MSSSSQAPLRGALIGCGFVAQHHLASWKGQPDAILAAVCDLDPARLAWAKSIVPEAAGRADARALLASGRLDFVEICPRPEPHESLVALAAEHRVHVLCQKPAALEREPLLAMIASCERAGVR